MTLSRGRLFALAVLTAVSMLPVTGLVPILKPLLLDRYGVQDLAASSFMALNMAGALVAAPLVGWLSDSRGWTRRLIASAAALEALVLVLMARAPSFTALAALRVLDGMAHITVLTLLLAIVSRHAGPGHRPRMALLGGAVVFGVALGAPLGGLLGRQGPDATLLAGAAVMAAVVLAVPFVAPSGVPPAARARGGLRNLLHVEPALRLPYLFAFVDRLTVGFFVYAFPMYAARELALGSARTGALIGAFMLPFAALCYPAGRRAARGRPWTAVLLGSVGYAAVYASYPWLGEGGLWPAMVLGGVLSAVMFGPTLILVLDHSSPAARATAMAGFNAAGSVGFLIGPLAAGAILQGLGADLAAYRVTFAVAATAQLLAVAWALRKFAATPRPT